MDWDEQSLMLYLEVCMVDCNGRVDARRISEDDLKIMTKFRERGLINFGRLPMKEIDRLRKMAATLHCHYWVEFSKEAWEFAHKFRIERSKRMIKKNPPPKVECDMEATP